MSDEIKMGESKTLVNVKKCFIINERTNEIFDIGDTASEVDLEPILSEGKRNILRVKNKIHGINITEDICIGYKIKLKDNTFSPQVMEIVDGGNFNGTSYKSIAAGEVVERDLFTLKVITEEKDYSRTVGFATFIWKHCKGKVPKYSIKDAAFIVPEFEAESIPFRGEHAVEIEFTKTIPNPKPNGSDTGTTDVEMKIDGNKVEKKEGDTSILVTSNIKFIFKNAINQDDVTKENFIVKNKGNGKKVDGSLTIDDDKKVVTFVPRSIERATYTAESKSINKLAGGKTDEVSVEFTVI